LIASNAFLFQRNIKAEIKPVRIIHTDPEIARVGDLKLDCDVDVYTKFYHRLDRA